MIYQLLVLVLILAIAFYQIVQGLYSATIMVIIAMLSSVIAFGFYEPLAEVIFGDAPGGLGASMLILFVAALLVLRITSDKFLKANVVFNQWIDRIGGGIVGYITSITCVGMLIVSMGMMPWCLSILGYESHDETLQESHLWLKPDEFVIDLNTMLSKGSLSGDVEWDKVHGDLRLENFCARNDAGLNCRTDALADALDAMNTYSDAGVYTFDDWQAFGLAANNPDKLGIKPPKPPWLDEGEYANAKVLVIRVKVLDTVRDEDDNFRLPASHFRLVTSDGKSHYPLAYLTNPVRPAKMDNIKNYSQYVSQLRPGGWVLATPPSGEAGPALAKLAVRRKWYTEGGPVNLTIDWVYFVGPKSRPEKMIFRRSARVNLKSYSEKNTMPKIRIEIPNKETGDVEETIVPLERLDEKP